MLEVQKALGQVRDRAVRLHLLQRRDDRAPIGGGRDLEVDRGRPRDLDTLIEGRRREGETPLASSHEIHRVDEDVVRVVAVPVEHSEADVVVHVVLRKSGLRRRRLRQTPVVHGRDCPGRLGGEVERAGLRLGEREARGALPDRGPGRLARLEVHGRLVHHAVLDVLEPVVEPAQELGIASLTVVPSTDQQLLLRRQAVEEVD